MNDIPGRPYHLAGDFHEEELRMCVASRKRPFLAVLTLFFAASMVTTGVFSYLVSSSETANRLNISHNSIEVVEDFDPPEEMKPGSSFAKEVRVRNTGTSDCYVRMFAEFSDSTAAAFATIMYAGAAGFNEADWEYDGADGYWYYDEVLEPGDMTEPLFGSVSIGSDGSVLKSFDILVYAESVQSGGYEDRFAAWAAFL